MSNHQSAQDAALPALSNGDQAVYLPSQVVPMTCHGHTRPVVHVEFSNILDGGGENSDQYYMVSACKDGNPMLRDGQKGDWVGTLLGHKGAVWQVRLSFDASYVITASADFTANIWDARTGEVIATITLSSVVRAVAFVHDSETSKVVAVGGMDKKLRLFDLGAKVPRIHANNHYDTGAGEEQAADPVMLSAADGIEIGVHSAAIKSIVPTADRDIIVTASDKTLSWFSISQRQLIHQEVLDGEIKSCESVSLDSHFTDQRDIGAGWPVLAVAAGKSVHFWSGPKTMHKIKTLDVDFRVASVGLDVKGGNIVISQDTPGTWAQIYSWADGNVIDTIKGHHGPIWSIAFSPDGKLFATASEDGTVKMWKMHDGPYGQWVGTTSL